MRSMGVAATALLVVAAAGGCRSPSLSPVPGQPSPGCGSRGGLVAGTTSHTIAVGGDQRSYLLSLPAVITAPAPLVFDFPGLGETNKEEAAYSDLAEEAAAIGDIGVTPEASATVPRWTIPPLPGPDDVKFVATLITSLELAYCIDPNRVFVAGISNGASFAAVLGCKLSSRIAGVAMVAGINAYAPCTSQPPVPVIGFNGTADPIVPFNGGNVFGGADQEGGGIVPSAMPALGGWARRNHCEGSAISTVEAVDVKLVNYSTCEADAQLYVLVGGGHTWPGAAPVAQKALGPTNNSIDATQMILGFFGGLP